MNYFVSATLAAEWVGRSERQINRWRRDGLVESQGNQVCLLTCLRYALQQANQAAEKAKGSQSFDELKRQKLEAQVRELDAKTRETEARATIRELERDKLEGLLIDREATEKEYSDYVLKARSRFLVIPTRMAVELAGIEDPKEIELRLRSVIHEALHEFAQGTLPEIDEYEGL